MLQSLCCLAARNGIKPARKAGLSEEKMDPSTDRSSYPFKIHPYDSWSYKVTDNDLAALHGALAGGVDLNQRWSKEKLVTDAPEPFGLCKSTILYFGAGTLRWECMCHYGLDADPNGSVSIPWDVSSDLKQRMRVKRAIRGISPPAKHPGWNQTPDDIWESQLRWFTGRDL
ncbi:hypothetical protein N0V84_008106 [Fusarium piperis]|uniref:Uncharacterized protein n=1 Tax=Fusarium piperis TaxID=1435070 RepID=A0A9W9BMI1_9HYPO|nr:hypothetical protein N0V84_008106 [Fusarium piperis]